MKRKELILVFVLAIFFSYNTFGQGVAVNNDGSNADASAMLDIKSANKGLLIPRVDIADLNTEAPVTSPSVSLLVYNTNTTTGVGYYYWDGTKWVRLSISNGSGFVDGEGVATRVAFWKDANTLDSDADLYWDNNNNRLGVGTTNPVSKLHVNGGNLSVNGANAISVGAWNTNTPSNSPTAQLVLSGVHNGSFNNGGTKLLIEGYDNESTTTIFKARDENQNIDVLFLSGDGSGGTPPVNYFKGNVGVGVTSPVAKLHVDGRVVTGREGVAGVYNSAQVQGIWSIGNDYKVDVANNNFGNQYGIVYAHTNAGTSGVRKPIPGWGHQILFTSNGVRNIALSLTNGNAYFSGNIGLGLHSPSEKLDVNGKIRMREGATANYIITGDANGVMSWTDPASVVPTGWKLNGNAGTTSGTNFLGTTDNQDLDFRTNNVIKARITTKGQLEIFNTVHSMFIGENAGENNTNNGYDNTATGYMSLYLNTNGYQNTAFGNKTLYSNTTGRGNTAVGIYTLYHNTTGFQNVGVGHALYQNTTGRGNVGIGSYALDDNTSGNFNTAVGYRSHVSMETGSYNTSIGYGANTAHVSYSYSTAIGYGAQFSANRQVRIGNASSNGATSIGGPVAWTNLSDGRFKDNVQENVAGLNFVMKLRPVTYNLNQEKLNDYLNVPDSLRDRATSAKDLQIVHTGFIAQEVEEAAKECNFDFHGVDAPKNEKDYYGLRYAEFVVPLVKATQEQQGIIKKQEEKIENLEQENAQIRKELNLLKEKINRLEIEK